MRIKIIFNSREKLFSVDFQKYEIYMDEWFPDVGRDILKSLRRFNAHNLHVAALEDDLQRYLCGFDLNSE
jgi:hypothetical protein